MTAVLCLIVGLVTAANAAPMATRTFDLYTAPIGPSLDGIMDQFKPLRAEANRSITNFQIIQRINIGKITGIRLTTSSDSSESATWLLDSSM